MIFILLRFTVVGNKAFFKADGGEYGHELWITDGTVRTHLVKDINPG